MLREYDRFLRLGLASLDGLIALGAFYAAAWIKFGPNEMLTVWDKLLPNPPAVLAVYVVAWVASLWLNGIYRPRYIWSRTQEAVAIFRAGLTLAVLAAFGMVLFKIEGVSRLFFGMFVTFHTGGTIVVHWGLRFALAHIRSRGFNARYLLVVGTGKGARDFAEAISNYRRLGFRVIGFLTNGEYRGQHGQTPDSSLDGLPLLGTVDRLQEVFRTHVVDNVVIALPFDEYPTISKVTQICQEQGKTVHLLMDLTEVSLARSRLEIVMGWPLLTFTSTPDQKAALVAKRVVDVVLSAVLLVVLSPLMLLVALLIRLDSPGPAVFRQRRVGLHGREFTMYKFRTMVVDAEKQLQKLKVLNEMNGPVFKIRRDPRITRIGRFLRRSSIDELPQLVNVLLGDMSLVGPRPPLPHEVAQYEPWQRKRLSMRPGMTCIWQVSGRNDVTFEDWVRMDLEYIDKWNLWLDFKILVQTIPAVFGLKGV